MQQILQREEEQIISDSAQHSERRVSTRPESQRSTTRANASQCSSSASAPNRNNNSDRSRQRNNRPQQRDASDIKCLGCGLVGHFMKTCPTTSVRDKQQIYDQMRLERLQNNAQPRRDPGQATPASAASIQSSQTPATSNDQATSQPRAANSTSAHRISYINAACARRIAQVNNARRQRGTNQRTRRNALHAPRIIQYEDEVIIDSGATDHVTGRYCSLYDPYPGPYPAEIILPDGSVNYSETSGTL
jgi:hypothetical protein